MTLFNRPRGEVSAAHNNVAQKSDQQIPNASNHDRGSPISDIFSWASQLSLDFESFKETPRAIADEHRAALQAEFLFNGAFTPVAQTESGATLYGPQGRELTPVSPPRPLKIAVLTSIRDVGVEEHVGKRADPNNPNSYVKGTIQTALEAVKDDRLGPFAEIVAIITDDLSKDLKRGDYVPEPSQQGAWIFPRDMRNQSGELATSLTVNVPSTFRSLPLKDVQRRQALKLEFESKIFKIIREAGADVLLSDHFLAKIDYLIRPDHFNMLGRVLNTHPGIIRPGHQYTCLGKNTYDHMRLHAQGFRLMPDKSIAQVPPCDIAGASFHVITEGIDIGPVLCDAELTRISPTDSDVTVARKLYKTSKYHAFIEGVRHYASTIFPMFRNN